MTETISRRLRALEGSRLPALSGCILTRPGESATDALRRLGLDPAGAWRLLVLIPEKREVSHVEH